MTSASLLKFLPFRDRYGYFGLASGGIGWGIGWGIAGAVGVQLAHPDRPVLALIGDGSATYSIQAIWSAARQKLPITYVIANNGGYRIIKQRLLSFHGNDQFIGMDFEDPPIDFVGLATSFGLSARRVSDPADVTLALREALANDGPNLIEIIVEGGVTR